METSSVEERWMDGREQRVEQKEEEKVEDNNNNNNMKSRNYRKQPYWALHTYCGKY